MSFDSYSIMESLPWFISIPLAFVATKYVSLTNKQAKTDIRVTALEQRDSELCKQIEKLTDALNENTKATANLSGRLDEHLRK